MPADLKSAFFHLTGARQTMMSWARVIDSIEAVPEIYKEAYQALTSSRDSLPYTVLVPSQGVTQRSKSGPILLCDLDDAFYVLEQAGAHAATIGYSYAQLSSFEVGNILLYSWFSIHGKTTAGADAELTVEFNEANLRYFEPFFCKMRPAPGAYGPAELNAEMAKFEHLATENFKLMNFARQSLVAGERVIQFIYQPPIRESLLRVLSLSLYRSLVLAHMVILTDQEIILLGDAEQITEKKRSRYGGVRRFLPRRSRISAQLEERPNDLLGLVLHISPDLQVERLFEANRRQEIEKMIKACHSPNTL